MSAFKLHLFGKPALAGSELLERMPLLVLAYLAVEGPQDKTALANLFWDKQPDEQRRYKGLSEALRRINDRAPGVIEEYQPRSPQIAPAAASTQSARKTTRVLNTRARQRGTVQLIIPSDTRELDAMLEQSNYQRVLDIYQGRFLEGLEGYKRLSTVAGVEWFLERRDHFQTVVLDVALRLGEAAAKQGQLAAAARYATRAWKIDLDVAGGSPDDLRRMHMLLLAAQDDQAADVAAKIRDNFEDIRLCESRSEAIARLERRFNVPRPPVLFGRDADLSYLRDQLDAGRKIITLTGLGGVGKSALALALADHVRGKALCEDGLVMVRLDTLPESSRPEDFLDAFARALGTALPADAITLESLADHVVQRSMMLIVDNAEHQVQHAGLISALHERCPTLTFIITSRQALTIQHELVVNLDGLGFPNQLPDAATTSDPSVCEQPADKRSADVLADGVVADGVVADGVVADGVVTDGERPAGALLNSVPSDLSSARNYPSLALLIEGIEQRGSVVDVDSLPDLVALAQLSEGLPLALRLAAHWVSNLPSSLVLEHFQEERDLDVPQADIDARHNSLTAAFDFSFNLLTKRQQQVLVALASFAGSFSHEAARAVSGASAKTLMALAAAHMLMRDGQRFRLHALIKQYLQGKADEQTHRTAATRHVSYYFEILRKHNETNTLSKLPTIFAQDEANLRTAFEVGMQYEMWDVLAGGVSGWRRYYELREQFNLIQSLLSKANAISPDKKRAAFISNLAWVSYRLGESLEAKILGEKAYKLCQRYENPRTMQRILDTLHAVTLQLGYYKESIQYAEESLANASGEHFLTATATGNLGVSLREYGNYRSALTQTEKAYKFYERVKQDQKLAWLEVNMGVIYYQMHNLEKARCWLEQGISRQQTFWLARQKLYLSMVALAEDSFEEAQELCSFVLDSTQKSKRKVLHAEALIQQARIYLKQRQAKQAFEVVQNALAELGETEMRNRQLQAEMVLAETNLVLGKNKLAQQQLSTLDDQRKSLSAFDQKGLDGLLERASHV
jgi:predicted ATPase